MDRVEEKAPEHFAERSFFSSQAGILEGQRHLRITTFSPKSGLFLTE